MSERESRTPPPDVVLPTLAAMVLGGFCVALPDVVIAAADLPDFGKSELHPLSYLVVLLALPTLVCGAHGAVGLVVLKMAQERGSRWLRAASWGLAAVVGLLWPQTVLDGDGIRAWAHYDLIRAAAWVVGPLGAVVATEVFARILTAAKRARPVLVLLPLTLGAASHFVLPEYLAFHGFSLLVAAALTTWVLAPWLASRRAELWLSSLFLVLVLAVLVVPGREKAQRFAQRHAHAPAALLRLPTTRFLEQRAVHATGVDGELLESDAVAALAAFPRPIVAGGGRKGRNILFVVLESVRHDSWSDDGVARRFAQWRRQGLYFPRAIAQYPATPLAYGAMFTSQTPTVLTGTPFWARSRIFELLVPEFDHLLLAAPNNPWFQHSAILDFFVPSGAAVVRHESAEEGLAGLRTSIEQIPEEESFFAWIHIYEPHEPWEQRPEFALGVGPEAAYTSELRYVDHHLGAFMEWFYELPRSRETLVVLVADHGEATGEIVAGERFYGHHVHVHGVLSNIPAYFSGPGLPSGAVLTEPNVQQMDVVPTFFDFMGVPIPESAFVQGRSVYATLADPRERSLPTEAFGIRGHEFFDFVARVRGAGVDEVRSQFAAATQSGAYPPKFSLQHGRYKLVHDRLIDEMRIYDIVDDPGETRDLSSSHPEIYENLVGRKSQWDLQQQFIIREFNATPR